jgi:hypothetical protein
MTDFRVTLLGWYPGEVVLGVQEKPAATVLSVLDH